MEDDFLTDEQYRDEFDLSPEEGRVLWQGTFARVGYVFGSEGENGSGVFVKTPSGRRALLTAEHVVREYISQGMWIGGYNDDIEDAQLGRTRRVAFCERAMSSWHAKSMMSLSCMRRAISTFVNLWTSRNGIHGYRSIPRC